MRENQIRNTEHAILSVLPPRVAMPKRTEPPEEQGRGDKKRRRVTFSESSNEIHKVPARSRSNRQAKSRAPQQPDENDVDMFGDDSLQSEPRKGGGEK